MTEDFFQAHDQLICFAPEQSIGHPYDPEAELTAWAKLPASYPFCSRFDVIPEKTELPLPIRAKEPQFDIGDGKVASVIATGNIEPVEITLATIAQILLPLFWAIGFRSAKTHSVAEVSSMTCIAKASIAAASYFLFNAIADTTSEPIHYGIWFDTTGTDVEPVVTGINPTNMIKADISGTSTAASVAVIVAACTASKVTIAQVGSTAVVTFTNTNAGAVIDIRDGGVSCGCTFSVTTQGVSTFTIAEELGYSLPTFTIHQESKNEDSGEDIIRDFMGCAISKAEINIDFGEKTVGASYTLKCPYAAVAGNRLTNPPTKLRSDTYTYGHLTQTASHYLLMEGTTSRNPEILRSIKITVENVGLEYGPDVSGYYAKILKCNERKVTVQYIGETKNNNLIVLYEDVWDNVNQRYSTATGKLNGEVKLYKSATDYINLVINNFLIRECTNEMISAKEGIRAIDTTLEGVVGDANGRQITTATIVGTMSEIFLPD